MYQHAAQTDRITDSTTISTLPTIWDELSAAGVDGRYYFIGVPFLALWGAKHIPISQTFPQFLMDCITNNLPSVAYLDPRFLGEEQGRSGDDHPHADIRNGEFFVWTVYEAATRSPGWTHTVFIFTFDEWGFFDHVPHPERLRTPVRKTDCGASAFHALWSHRTHGAVLWPATSMITLPF